MADKPFGKFIDDVIRDMEEANRRFCDGCSSEDLTKTLLRMIRAKESCPAVAHANVAASSNGRAIGHSKMLKRPGSNGGISCRSGKKDAAIGT